jgi:glucose-6-phosphate isomerase
MISSACGWGEIEEEGMDEAATAPLWQRLHAMRGELKQKSLYALFEEDKGRFAAFSLTDEDLLLDFSKTKTSRATLSLLLRLAAAAGVEAEAQLRAQGVSADEAHRLAPHETFLGERPSVTTAYRTLDPFALGRLIALYEHRVFVEAAIFNTNAFDQWGVELGKELATTLLPMVKGKKPPQGDASTVGLMRHLASLGGRE